MNHLIVNFLLTLSTTTLLYTILTSNNLLIWWTVTLLLTGLIMLSINTTSTTNHNNVYNYFIAQELLSLIILFTILTNATPFLTCVLIANTGVAPFHFWVLPVVVNAIDYTYLYVNTIANIPFMGIIIQTITYNYWELLLIGAIIGLMQIATTTGWQAIFVLSSTCTYNLLLLITLNSGATTGLIYILFYFYTLAIFLNPTSSANLNLSAIVFIWFIAFPLTITFQLKLLLSISVYTNFPIMLLIFILPISITAYLTVFYAYTSAACRNNFNSIFYTTTLSSYLGFTISISLLI